MGILKYKVLFDKLEQAISERIMNSKICMAWNRPMKNVRGLIVENDNLKNTNITINEQLKQKQEENDTKQELLQEKEIMIEKLNQELNNIKNSRLWKITKPFRKIKKYLK